ncbi:hypothetical protein ANTQUA_LOCUS4223 [Anthophora quadrimaculata]
MYVEEKVCAIRHCKTSICNENASPSPFSVSAKKGSNLCNIPEIHNILKLQPSSVKCREHETQRTNNG